MEVGLSWHRVGAKVEVPLCRLLDPREVKSNAGSRGRRQLRTWRRVKEGGRSSLGLAARLGEHRSSSGSQAAAGTRASFETWVSSCGGNVGAGSGSGPSAPPTLRDLGQLAVSLGLGFLISVMRRPD